MNILGREAHAARSYYRSRWRFVVVNEESVGFSQMILLKEAVMMFEKVYEVFWEEQVYRAGGQRLEMLQRDLTGSKKLLEKVILPYYRYSVRSKA